jgi:hypothetical protein
MTIAVSNFGTRPEPTGVALFDFGPEAFLECGRKSLRGQILNRNLRHLSGWLDGLAGATSLFHDAKSNGACQ